MGDFSPWDVTDSFVEAVQIWSEHLTGNRGTDWGTVGAFHFFVDLGMAAPATPAPIDVVTGLRCMAQEAARMRDPATHLQTTTRKVNAMNKVAARVNSWMQGACGSSFDSSVMPTDAMATTVPDLDTAITAAQAVYQDPRSAISGFDLTQAAANFDYSQIPTVLDTTVPQDDRNLVDNSIDAEYWSPPPPESHFRNTYGDIV